MAVIEIYHESIKKWFPHVTILILSLINCVEEEIDLNQLLL